MNKSNLIYQMKVAMFLIGLLAATIIRAQVTTFETPVFKTYSEAQTYASHENDNVTNADLLKNYVQQRFDEMLPSYTKPLRRSAADYLSGKNLKAYNYIKGVVKKIAKGEISNTSISIPLTEITSDVGPWTAEDLGVDAIVVNNTLNPAVQSAIKEKVAFDLHVVITALMADCPYELYWYDKTAGCSYKPFGGYSYNKSKVSITGDATFTMNVAQGYAVQESSTYSYYPTLFNTDMVAAVDVAIANAKKIADETTGSILVKLTAFKNKICELTSYNNTAAKGLSYPYGDPWQLVWVFDGDESTKVVCEGYAKAFKYLCDLSNFQDAECLLASGTMSGGSGAGEHMWNVMKMDDGYSYLIDVTNCDEGTIGAPNLLFMAYGPSGSYNQTYTFPVRNTSINYTYDDDTKASFSKGELTISDTEYLTRIAGDANNDGEVNVSDIQEIVNYIMGKPSANFKQTQADLNGDGEINVTDIVKVVSIIMGNSNVPDQTPIPEMADNGKLTVSSIELKAGELQQVAVNLNNDSKKYAAFQYDFTLPEGITIAKNNKGELMINLNADRIGDHTLTVQDLGSGSYRLLCFSMTNAEFSGTSGALVNMTLKADDNVSIGTKEGVFKSPVFTEADGSQEKWADVTFNIFVMPDVIPEVTADDKTREYGEENPELTYTVNAELIGKPELTTTATKTSPVGEYDIVVGMGTIEGFYTAKNGKLTITKAPLTITAKNDTIKQGEALPTFEVEYSGFKNDETEAVLTKKPTFSCSAAVGSEPGEYDITVSGAEAANYELSYVAGKLIVVQADPVTVTAKSCTRKYGEANPTFEYTSEGAELNGTPEITCEATATSPVGTYLIVIKKGDVKNYNDTYVNGVLTITKAPLTITAKNYTIKQGEALPTFEAEYSGFKNNDTEAVLTMKPTFSCSAVVGSEPGTYDITVSGAEAQNYEMTYVAGKLIVDQADPVTVTAKSYTREYGEANPMFEYTSEGAELNGSPEITCEATESSPVGTYLIVIKKGDVTNYNDTYVNGVLTITKAPLTVKVEDATREQYLENPEFVITYTGWKVGDEESVLMKKPTATTTATKESPVGSYDIVVSGGEAENYELLYQNGVLTVTESTGIATISAKNPVDIYTLQGRKVRTEAKTLEGLPKGVYIVNGRKVVVK